MKTASLVLGIIGGVLAIIFAIMFIASGALVNTAVDTLEGFDAFDEVYNAAVGATTTWLYVAGILSIIGGILGIVGGALAKKKNVLAGILLVVAAIASLFTALGFIATILFVLAAVFAFIPEKSAPAVAA